MGSSHKRRAILYTLLMGMLIIILVTVIYITLSPVLQKFLELLTTTNGVPPQFIDAFNMFWEHFGLIVIAGVVLWIFMVALKKREYIVE